MTLIGVQAQTRTGKPTVTPVETAALALSSMDVVYVVRPGDDNENLRYSLRSLENLPHRNVFIVGYCPSWVGGVRYFETDQLNKPDQENSNNNLRMAADSPFLSDNFIFMNDDFMVMEPATDLPMMHQGSLNARIAAYKSGNRFHQAYSLIATRTELEKLMQVPLLSYELHMPMTFNRAKVQQMFELWSTTGRPLFSLRPRTFYGNLYQEQGVEVEDAKTSSKPTSQFVSTITGATDDECWAAIRRRFPTPGKYEATGS